MDLHDSDSGCEMVAHAQDRLVFSTIVAVHSPFEQRSLSSPLYLGLRSFGKRGLGLGGWEKGVGRGIRHLKMIGRR